MIQRAQSIYLLVATLLSAALFYIPLFELPAGASGEMAPYLIQKNALLLILNIAIGSLSFITIFFFKNRRLQIRACRLCLMLIFVLIALLFYTSDAFSGGLNQKVSFKMGVYFPLIQIIMVFLAQRGIKKDDELVRSADRLR